MTTKTLPAGPPLTSPPPRLGHKALNRQMSMPKPVCPNMATATPLGPPGPQTAQKQYTGSLEVDAQPSAARIRLPEGAARKVSASVRRAYIPDISAASDPRTGDLEGS
jgi:hypothetical protein